MSEYQNSTSELVFEFGAIYMMLMSLKREVWAVFNLKYIIGPFSRMRRPC
jgi:hypothetical protein